MTGQAGAAGAEKSLLSELIDAFNAKFGTDFTEEEVRKPFNKTTDDPKVRRAAVVNDKASFGKVFDRAFADNMADHIEATAGIGRQYFGPDKSFRSDLDRSARRAAWRMIRREEDVDE